MRVAEGILIILLFAAPVGAACGGGLRDWGLHRHWRVERDRAHPERPARLVEIAWEAAESAGCAPPRPAGPAARKVVRPGARVTVVARDAGSSVELRGTALEAGAPGDVIRVRAGLSGAVLRGRVRGPGLLDLDVQRGR